MCAVYDMADAPPATTQTTTPPTRTTATSVILVPKRETPESPGTKRTACQCQWQAEYKRSYSRDTKGDDVNAVYLIRQSWIGCLHPFMWASVGLLLSTIALFSELQYAQGSLLFEPFERVTNMRSYSDTAYIAPMNLDFMQSVVAKDGTNDGWELNKADNAHLADYLDNKYSLSDPQEYPLGSGTLLNSFLSPITQGSCIISKKKRCKLVQFFVASVHVFYTAIAQILRGYPDTFAGPLTQEDKDRRMIISFLDRMLGAALDQLLQNIISAGWKTSTLGSTPLPSVSAPIPVQHQVLALIVSANQLARSAGQTKCLLLCSRFALSQSCDAAYGSQYSVGNLTKASVLEEVVEKLGPTSQLPSARLLSSDKTCSVETGCVQDDGNAWSADGRTVSDVAAVNNAAASSSALAPWHSWIIASNATEVVVAAGAAAVPLAQVLHSHCTLVHSSRIWASSGVKDKYWDVGIAHTVSAWDAVKSEFRSGRETQVEGVATTFEVSACFTMVCASLLFLCVSLVMLIAVSTNFVPQRLVFFKSSGNNLDPAALSVKPSGLRFLVADSRIETLLLGTLCLALVVVVLLRIVLLSYTDWYAVLSSQMGFALDEAVPVILSPKDRRVNLVHTARGLIMPLVILFFPLTWRYLVLVSYPATDTGKGWVSLNGLAENWKVNGAVQRAALIVNGTYFPTGVYSDRIYEDVSEILDTAPRGRNTKSVGGFSFFSCFSCFNYLRNFSIRNPESVGKLVLVAGYWFLVLYLFFAGTSDLFSTYSQWKDMVMQDVFDGEQGMEMLRLNVREKSLLLLTVLAVVALHSVYGFTRGNLEEQYDLLAAQQLSENNRTNITVSADGHSWRSIMFWGLYSLLISVFLFIAVVAYPVAWENKIVYGVLLAVCVVARISSADFMYVRRLGSSVMGKLQIAEKAGGSTASDKTVELTSGSKSAFPSFTKLSFADYRGRERHANVDAHKYRSVCTVGEESDSDL